MSASDYWTKLRLKQRRLGETKLSVEQLGQELLLYALHQLPGQEAGPTILLHPVLPWPTCCCSSRSTVFVVNEIEIRLNDLDSLDSQFQVRWPGTTVASSCVICCFMIGTPRNGTKTNPGLMLFVGRRIETLLNLKPGYCLVYVPYKQ